MTCPALCKRCGSGPLVPDSTPRGDAPRPRRLSHIARGLCGTCYDQEESAGTLLDWPRLTWRTEDLVADAELYRATRYPPRDGRRRPVVEHREVFTWAEVAAVFGVKETALLRARSRVRAAARVAT